MKYHDGETVTAEDALYSLQYAGTSPMYSSFYANVDWEGSSVVDERTFTLQLLSPQATFWDEVVSAVTFVFPAGSAGDDFSGDIGSGPFKLVSFSPDTGAVLEKNAVTGEALRPSTRLRSSPSPIPRRGTRRSRAARSTSPTKSRRRTRPRSKASPASTF